MERLYEGWTFTCQECGNTHILPNSYLPKTPKEQLRIPCRLNKKAVHIYQRKDFSRWAGLKRFYVSGKVKPIK